MAKKIRTSLSVSVVIPTYNRPKELKRCLLSVLSSKYQNIKEIIVIDNNTDKTSLNLVKKYAPIATIIHEGKNNGHSWSKNYGARIATGDWILFIDDDNVIDEDMIGELVKAVRQNDKIGALSPLQFNYNYPDKIWFCGAEISLTTSKARFLKVPPDVKSFYPSGTIHNIFMVKKTLGDQFHWFDPKMFIVNDEFDLFIKIRRAGYILGIMPTALSWHDIELFNELRLINTPLKAFHVAQNRAIIMKRYAQWWQIVLFLFLFYPLFFCYYLFLIIKNGQFALILPHFNGTLAGYKDIIFGGE